MILVPEPFTNDKGFALAHYPNAICRKREGAGRYDRQWEIADAGKILAIGGNAAEAWRNLVTRMHSKHAELNRVGPQIRQSYDGVEPSWHRDLRGAYSTAARSASIDPGAAEAQIELLRLAYRLGVRIVDES